MAILRIRHFPDDPVLRQKAKRVSAIDSSIQRLIDDMEVSSKSVEIVSGSEYPFC